MPFDAWPDVRASCPVCGAPACAVYRGYYERLAFCAELEFVGRLAVRTGFCKRRRARFSLLPDFLIPFRRLSRFSLDVLAGARKAGARATAAIDALNSDLGEEFYLPLSTAYSYFAFAARGPP